MVLSVLSYHKYKVEYWIKNCSIND